MHILYALRSSLLCSVFTRCCAIYSGFNVIPTVKVTPDAPVFGRLGLFSLQLPCLLDAWHPSFLGDTSISTLLTILQYDHSKRGPSTSDIHRERRPTRPTTFINRILRHTQASQGPRGWHNVGETSGCLLAQAYRVGQAFPWDVSGLWQVLRREGERSGGKAL